MKTYILLFLLLLPTAVIAQDVIILSNNKRIENTIVENVSEFEIKYKINGETKSISANEVFAIIYEDGRYVEISHSAIAPEEGDGYAYKHDYGGQDFDNEQSDDISTYSKTAKIKNGSSISLMWDLGVLTYAQPKLMREYKAAAKKAQAEGRLAEIAVEALAVYEQEKANGSSGQKAAKAFAKKYIELAYSEYDFSEDSNWDNSNDRIKDNNNFEIEGQQFSDSSYTDYTNNDVHGSSKSNGEYYSSDDNITSIDNEIHHISYTVEDSPEREKQLTQTAAENKRKAEKLKADKEGLEFTADGGNDIINIYYRQTWEVAYCPNWINYSHEENILKITCSNNTGNSPREDDMIITSTDGQKLTIVISQEENKNFLHVYPDLVNDNNGLGGEIVVDVISHLPWKIESLPTWCSTQQNGNKLKLILQRNLTGIPRNGVIVIRSEKSKQEIAIKQPAAKQYLVLSNNTINDPTGKGGNITVTVETDYPEWNIEHLPDWCSITEQTPSSFTLKINDNNGGNSREAYCQVYAGDIYKDIKISQAERKEYINVQPNLVHSKKQGGIITINVDSSIEWKVVNLPSWCHIIELTEKSFTLRVDKNEEDEPRSVSVAVSAKGMREKIHIDQE
ncbi:MAG: BACON domain-containing protein [Paludibacteraceae bacterium]|nr:BACON domain-containing protein [Paludibacteraceae bacterium]